MAYFGKILPKPDGTEGYASITLTLKEPDDRIETIACFIKNDGQLQELQFLNESEKYVKTHQDQKTKFFLYLFCSESNLKLSTRLVQSEIVAHRSTKPKRDKKCIIENKLETQPFFLKPKCNHVFLPACHEYLKSVEFEFFLSTYSSAITMKNLSAGKYRGVQNSHVPDRVKYSDTFSLSSSNNTLNITNLPKYKVFQNLVDGPLLLFEEASCRLIGWYKKAPEGDRITVYNLGTQDTTDICQSGLTGPPTSTDQANQSVSAIQPTCTDQSHQSGPPIATSPNPPGSTGLPTSTNSQPNPPESTGPSTSTDAQPNPPGSIGPSTSTDAQPNPPGSTGLPTSTNSQPNPNYQGNYLFDFWAYLTTFFTGLLTRTNSQPNPPGSAGLSTSTNSQPNPPGSAGLSTSTNAQQNPPGSTGLPTSTNSQGSPTNLVLESATGANQSIQFLIKIDGFDGDAAATILDHHKGRLQHLLVDMQEEMFPKRDIIITRIYYKCIIIQLLVKTIEALEELWKRYKNGDLENALEKVLITDEIRKLGKTMEMVVTMSEEQYLNARSLLGKQTQHQEKGNPVGEDEPIKEHEDESERRKSAPGTSLEEEDGVSTVQPRVEPGHEVIINPLNQVHAQEEAAPALSEDPSVADPFPANQPVATSLQDQPPSGSNANVSSDGANGQQYRVLQNQPTENSMQYNPPIQSSDSTVGLSSHGVNGQQALQDLLNNDYVVDCLAINLDIDYSLQKNWRHLAEEMEAPQDIKDKCNCNTVHSPTLTFLERPDIRNKTIQELMNAAAKRKDVLNILEEKFSEEDRTKSIEEALRCNPELMDEIATKLDQPSNRILENWKDFGKSLRIDEDELDLIENGGHNPAEKLLLYAYSSLPPSKMKAKEFQAIIMGFTKREDLHKLLVNFEITENDVRHLKDIIPPNSENMKIMTAALNRCSPGLQNWKDLASIWGCESDHFDYPPKQSPTKTLLEWVCKTMDRKFTVDQFLNILGEIKRYDVKQKLKEVIEKNR